MTLPETIIGDAVAANSGTADPAWACLHGYSGLLANIADNCPDCNEPILEEAEAIRVAARADYASLVDVGPEAWRA